jgi:hypothetical protein
MHPKQTAAAPQIWWNAVGHFPFLDPHGRNGKRNRNRPRLNTRPSHFTVGMRPKCTVVDADGRLAIGKFPSVQDERSVTKGECSP